MPGKKLLVADDSLTIQKVIRLALSNEGYEIYTVPDGPEAIQRIFLSRPDIVLIDVSLPGKSGFEVKREINQHDDLEEVRFVLMSSAFEKVDESQIEEVGFHGRLTKPFDPAHLRAVLTESLAQVKAKRLEKTAMIQRPVPGPPSLPPSLPPTFGGVGLGSGPPPLPGAPLHATPPPPPIPHSGLPPRPPGFPALPPSTSLGSPSGPPPRPSSLPPLLPPLMMTPPPMPDLMVAPPLSSPPSLPPSLPPLPGTEENPSPEFSSSFPPLDAPPFSPSDLPSDLQVDLDLNGASSQSFSDFTSDWAENNGSIPASPLPSSFESDIKSLTASTIQISGLEDYDWSVGEPGPKKHLGPEDVSLPGNSDFSPDQQEHIAELVKKQVQLILQEMTQQLLPDLAEKIIKQEIHKMLTERS